MTREKIEKLVTHADYFLRVPTRGFFHNLYCDVLAIKLPLPHFPKRTSVERVTCSIIAKRDLKSCRKEHVASARLV